MARHGIVGSELLLVALRLLEQRPMDARDLLVELDRLFGPRDCPTPGSVLIALDALEAEALVEVAAHDGPAAYRITAAGGEAVARRAEVAVLPPSPRARRRGFTARAAPAHELEYVAILFTDVVQSTEMLDRLGDEATHGIRRRHFELLRRAIRDHRGREVKSLGDGLMVVFDSPQAAAVGALAMQRTVAACDDQVGLRVGIAAGEAVRRTTITSAGPSSSPVACATRRAPARSWCRAWPGALYRTPRSTGKNASRSCSRA
jgi:DNA-binding PadR family transcriptional regulator